MGALSYGGFLLIAAMAEAGRVHFLPIFALGIAGWVVLRAASLAFLPAKGWNLAVNLSSVGYPAIWDLARKAAAEVGSKPPDRIVLGMSSSFHVTQAHTRLPDGAEVHGRILHLSAPLLKILSKRQLMAILGHEFSHFTGGDTLYSAHVAPAYFSCQAGVRALAGQITGANSSVGCLVALLSIPSLILVYLYLMGFRLIDMSLSRLRELRADRQSARSYGRDAMASALVRVVGYGRILAQVAWAQFHDLLKKGRAFVNYPEYFGQNWSNWSNDAATVATTALNRKTAALDTHPALNKRLLALGVSMEQIDGAIQDSSQEVSNYELTEAEEKLTALYGSLVESTVRDGG